MSYTSIRVSRGSGGWGAGFVLTPTAERHTVISVTGGGIHPVAQKIADLSGATSWTGSPTTSPTPRCWQP